MSILCGGKGAFVLDLEADGCCRSTRGDASVYEMGEPGGVRMCDLVPLGLGLF